MKFNHIISTIFGKDSIHINCWVHTPIWHLITQLIGSSKMRLYALSPWTFGSSNSEFSERDLREVQCMAHSWDAYCLGGRIFYGSGRSASDRGALAKHDITHVLNCSLQSEEVSHYISRSLSCSRLMYHIFFHFYSLIRMKQYRATSCLLMQGEYYGDQMATPTALVETAITVPSEARAALATGWTDHSHTTASIQ
jgi:hypothetical protein